MIVREGGHSLDTCKVSWNME